MRLTVRKRGKDLSAAKPVFGSGRKMMEIKGQETAAHRGTEGASSNDMKLARNSSIKTGRE